MTRYGKHSNHYDNFQFKKVQTTTISEAIGKKKNLFIDIDKGINSFNICLSPWIL